MYSTIIIECQTKNSELNCECCIARRVCSMTGQMKRKLETPQLELVVLPIQTH